MDQAIWVPYSKIDWSKPGHPVVIRPWRFISNSDPNQYMYNIQLKKWFHTSQISLVDVEK